MSSSKDESGGIPASNKGTWTSFLKSIASFNGDLASLTAPPFILSGTSLTEYSGYWAEHPVLFIAPAKEQDPEKRALAVLKWFLSTLKQQYSSRNEKLGSEKKPLNPFLGELFLGTWKDETGEIGDTVLISEQVSHHPPVTAYSIFNEKHKVRLEGYNGQRASFSGRTITVKQIGHAKYHLDGFDEDYLITLPSLHIEGLVYGSPYVELNRSTLIQSSSGYLAKIDYSGKGWLSGKKNSFTATLVHDSNPSQVLYTVDGQWTGDFTIKDARTKKEIETYNAKTNKITPLTIAPIEKQGPLETRRAWAKVAAAIEKGDYETTGIEKSKIENEQRELRKKEKEAGIVWERRYFTRVDNDEKFSALAERAGVVAEPEKTGGMWVFDQEKYHKVKESEAAAEATATSQEPGGALAASA
ncbi:hypothetical protein BDZ91DRAFT_661688 [Kalaharituber pfeilii]|nr:hypothetical protein BDZ91DRAFT_661688 [Kalaharituber pfeilii]